MKNFLLSVIRFSILAALLGYLVSFWFGINIPLFKKGAPTAATLKQRMELPPGFNISVYADQLPGARMLRLTDTGDLLVSLPRRGKIVLLEHDNNNDSLPDGQQTLIDNLNLPTGLDIHQNWLYIAETDAIGRIKFDSNTGKTTGDYQHIITDLPTRGNHWTRTIRFGPDGFMYVSVGSSCNACEEQNQKRAAITRYTADGSQEELFASGLRNTVGFDWKPDSHVLYGVDNGRDFLGDDFPPCELNRLEQGGFYGWPYANGNNIPDPDFGVSNTATINNSIAPVFEFGAHTAPLGITFLRSPSLPVAFQGAALVALHGSWNRSEKIGYKVVSMHFANNGKISKKDFIRGFERDGDVIGRPVDIAEARNGIIYISDDFTDSIYRVSYEN